jgi:biopolymer transport protein ExbB/TolQ
MTEVEWGIIQKIILVLIQVAIPPLLAWGIAELRRYLGQLRQKEEWEAIKDAVRVAVDAAEQLGLTDQLEEYGEDKLAAALEFVEDQLEAQGIMLDIDQYADAIRAMIEAEVKNMNWLLE